MTHRSILHGVAGLVFAAALAACGQPAPSDSRLAVMGTPRPLALVDDGCAGAAPVLSAAACANPDVRTANQTLTRLVRVQAGKLSREGGEIFLDGHAHWLAALTIACGLGAGQASLPPEATACARSWMFDRLVAVAQAVELIGPYMFQQVDVVSAGPAAAHAPGSAGVMTSIAYPRIDSTDPHALAFNNAARRAPRFAPADRTEEIVVYRVAYASRDLVSVYYQHFEMTARAARPDRDMEALTFLMTANRPIAPEDIFRPDSAWRDFLAQEAGGELRAAAVNRGCDAPRSDAYVRDAVSRPDRWVVSEGGLTILFPPHALGPYSLEGCEITIPWRTAAAYLNPSAPAPVGRAAGAPGALRG